MNSGTSETYLEKPRNQNLSIIWLITFTEIARADLDSWGPRWMIPFVSILRNPPLLIRALVEFHLTHCLEAMDQIPLLFS